MIDLKSLKGNLILTTFGAFAVFLLGFLFIYLFKNDLFYSLDNFRLIMLACAISIPLIIFNSFFVVITWKDDEAKLSEEQFLARMDHKLTVTIFVACVPTMLALLIPLLIAFFFDLYNPKLYYGIVLTMEVIFIIISIIEYNQNKKEEERDKPKS